MSTREPRVSNSVLGRAFQRGLNCRGALTVLISMIAAKDYKPAFSKKEVDTLFKKEILKNYGQGRYKTPSKLDDLEKWTDLINNIANALLSNTQFFADEAIPTHHKLALCETMQKSLARLMIVENWIYYHQKSIKKVL